MEINDSQIILSLSHLKDKKNNKYREKTLIRNKDNSFDNNNIYNSEVINYITIKNKNLFFLNKRKKNYYYKINIKSQKLKIVIITIVFIILTILILIKKDLLFYFGISKIIKINNNKRNKIININNFENNSIENNTFKINNLESKILKVNNLENIFNCDIKSPTILIFEPNDYHYECTPGFTKYFIDLGYNVDIIMKSKRQDTFCLFEIKEKIRIFNFNNLTQINYYYKNLTLIFNKYNYILVQTTDVSKKNLYEELKFFKMKNTIFVLHNIKFGKYLGISKLYNQNKIWSIANFSNALQVNPHYFGNIKIKNKNNITKFFITSSMGRNYTNLVLSCEKLIKENLKFEIIVIGWCKQFRRKLIPKKIRNNFKFKYQVSYSELYHEVENSDYIIINLDPNNKKEEQYKTLQATGSAQLSYGFSKPVLINKFFANIYGMNSNNSFLFDNSNLYNVMYDAIVLSDEDYKQKQNNLIRLSEKIYKISLAHVNLTLSSIIQH